MFLYLRMLTFRRQHPNCRFSIEYIQKEAAVPSFRCFSPAYSSSSFSAASAIQSFSKYSTVP